MKKKTRFWALALSFCCLLSLAACKGNSNPPASSQPGDNSTPSSRPPATSQPSGHEIVPHEKDADPATLILGYDPARAPMSFAGESGKVQGFDIDVAQAVCDRLGWTLTLEPIEWATAEDDLNSGRIDCIWSGMSLTQARLDALSCSIPYMKNNQVLVVASSSSVKTAGDLAGKTLALQKDSDAAAALDQNADFKASLGAVTPCESSQAALSALQNGEADAALVDQSAASYAILQGAGCRMLEEPFKAGEYGVGFRRDDPLCGQVNAILGILSYDGTLAQIADKWFQADVNIVPVP